MTEGAKAVTTKRAPRMPLDEIPPSPNLDFETALWQAGVRLVAGVDEAGRGALAGPVVAGAVILPTELDPDATLPGVRDSKQMAPAARQYWSQIIKTVAVTWAVGSSSNVEIDELGIVPATLLAMVRALDALAVGPEHILIDYLMIAENICPQTALVKGDARSLSIAAASIIAKTARDEVMVQQDQQLPMYGFAHHKGYGTLAHRQALIKLGASPIHRRSFHVKKGVDDEESD